MIETQERLIAAQHQAAASSHPLDQTTRDLIALLAQRSQMIETLNACLSRAAAYPALHDLLQRMRNADSSSIQELETLVRRRLRPYGPDAQAEPW